MRHIGWFLTVVWLLAGCSTTAREEVAEDGVVTKEQRLAWFKEAKFGMFIHWGPYSALAGEWQGRRVEVGRNAEWIMNLLRIPVEDYRERAHRFNPRKFNAQKWVGLAKSTGMKYLVITAKHHDGFAMYHSRVTPYNIVDWTPFKRDPLKELSEECRRQGIRFCVYYSHREDWDEPFAYGDTWDFDFDPETHLDQFESRYVERKAKPQLRELLTGYGPLGLVWFDRGMYTPEEGNAFADLVHRLQPECLVNGRVGNYEQELLGDYQNLGDNGMPIGGIDEYWESPQTLNDTWGYSRFDTGWKQPREVVERLAAIVSAGGNFLLNIGPDGEGVIPAASVQVLEAVGRWMAANGEAIYGTSASPFGPLPWGYCTVRGNRLYLQVFHRPDSGEIVLPGLRNAVRAVHALSDPSQTLNWRREGPDIRISLPPARPGELSTALAADIDGRPEVDPPVVTQDPDGGIDLDYVPAVTTGGAAKRFNRKGQFHIAKMREPRDAVSWRVQVEHPGRFLVTMTYAAGGASAGSPFSVAFGAESLSATVEATGQEYDYSSHEIGTVKLGQPGTLTVTLRPSTGGRGNLMNFKSLRLTPTSR